MKLMKRKILVVACGRSGTKHIANFLRKCGLKVGHEQVKEDGCSSAFFVTLGTPDGDIPPSKFWDCVHLPAQKPNQYEFEHIWHQTREPLKVIGSVRDVHKSKVVQWSRDCLHQEGIGPGVRLKHDLEYAARHWLLTNQMCERIATWRYKVEDLERLFPTVVKKLGLAMPDDDCPDVSKTMGRSYRTVKIFKPVKEIYDSITYPSWDDLHAIDPKLCKAIQVKARKYGYDV